MNEEKNNNLEENNNTENLGYSFDFANQVETEPLNVTPIEQPAVNIENPATQVVEQPTVEPVQTVETPVAEPQMVDVSVPVMDTTIPNNNQEPVQNIEPTQEPVNQSQEVQTTDLKDGKSTVRFVIILAVIVIAFIIALPFILNFLG